MNKFVLVAIVLASISGIGALSHNMFQIDLQSLQVFSSIDEFTDPICSCEGDDGFFSPANCDGFAPGGEYIDPNGLCIGIAPAAEYGEPPKLLDAQGCGASFWSNNISADPSIASIESASTVWPAGYQPDYYYEDMFQTKLIQTSSVLAENEEQIDEKIKIKVDEVEKEQEKIEKNEDKLEEKIEKNEDKLEEKIEKNEDKLLDENQENVDDVNDKVKKTNPDNSGSDKGLTLLDALKSEGGDIDALIRESVAAMLNAAHSDINYPYTVPQIIAMTQIALNSEKYQSVSDEFADKNDNLEKPPLCLE